MTMTDAAAAEKYARRYYHYTCEHVKRESNGKQHMPTWEQLPVGIRDRMGRVMADFIDEVATAMVITTLDVIG